MRILITGACGFVGNSLSQSLAERISGIEITGIDNLSRPGSELNCARMRSAGINLIHGDLRMASDLEALPKSDWVIDAAANPSVLAGVDNRSSSRQLVEHNLLGTLNLLEYCRRCNAGVTLLSTSRVYSIPALASLPLRSRGDAFVLDQSGPLPPGVSEEGISESFSTASPVSLYGATKLASEAMALEYGATFGFPVWVNRCGVLSGAGQFGTAEQGIFSYWLHAHASRRPLRYIGFGGKGLQVRDALHPRDLASLVAEQIRRGSPAESRVFNAGGGVANAMSLAGLTKWCDRQFGAFAPEPDLNARRFDIPWLVMDSRLAREQLDWQPTTALDSILDEIARHVRDNPGWLKEQCGI